LASYSEAPQTWLIFTSAILLLVCSVLFVAPILLASSANAEDVIFIIPGSSDASVTPSFDPILQIIQKGQSVVFVNADGLDHQLSVRSANGDQVFDTGVLKKNDFVSHMFSENGQYSIQDQKYSHMKGKILVTDDIATFTQTIENQKLDVQLTRTPANPGLHQEVYYKITFINKDTGRNHPHIDFTFDFDDSSGNFYDGVGGHTVDGQEFARFKFDKEDTFTPTITVSGIDLVPIIPEKVTFDTVVTPEFMPSVLSAITAGTIAATIALYGRKSDYDLK